MANGPANRGSLFNVRRAVLHSLRRFPFILSNVSLFKVRYSMVAPFAICLVIRRAVRHLPRHSPRRSPFAAPFAIRRAVRHSLRRSPFAAPFPIHFPQFSLFKLRYSMFAAPLAIRIHLSPIRRAVRCRFSMSPDAFHTNVLNLSIFVPIS